MCAEGAYKVYKSECAIRCPEHYIKDDVNHICSFEMSLTCEIDEKYCTSCPNGRYLTDDHKCQTCEDFWKDDMVVGSSGACLENLSDG
jgi:hypothetical protein